VPASLLITPPSVPAEQRPALGPFSSDLTDVLAQHVRVADIQDEQDFYQVFENHLRAARCSVWIWAAWTASRVESLLPALADVRARDVPVRVFVRDDNDTLQKKPEFQRYLAALRGVVSSVVAVNMMHQKIIVIDERVVLIGSQNVLSQRWTREVMLVMEGHHFARKLLEYEHAADFATPPCCGACGGSEVDLRRRKNGEWYWRCFARACPAKRGTQAWTTNALPARPAAKGTQPK
jgi:phosphatidylserine/phosphatidylglycerophosphate/cardiolipin synthase-like enzyme